MSKVDPDDAAFLLCSRGDSLDVEQLARKEVYPCEQHHRDLIAFLLQQFCDRLLPNCELSLSRTSKNEPFFRIDPMMNDLCLDRVGIGWKRRILHYDFKARLGRSIKSRHHQMQVHR